MLGVGVGVLELSVLLEWEIGSSLTGGTVLEDAGAALAD